VQTRTVIDEKLMQELVSPRFDDEPLPDLSLAELLLA